MKVKNNRNFEIFNLLSKFFISFIVTIILSVPTFIFFKNSIFNFLIFCLMLHSILMFLNFYNLKKRIKKLSPIHDLAIDEYKALKLFISASCNKLGICRTPRLIITEEPKLAFIMGNYFSSAIVISNDILLDSSNEEINGIISHELAHLYYDHVTIKAIFYDFKNILKEIESIFGIIFKALEFISRLIPFFGVVLGLVFNIFSLLLTTLMLSYASVVSFLDFIFSRNFEYSADKFTVHLNTEIGLISYLKKVHECEETKFFNLDDHPSTIKRIKILEKHNTKKQKKLFNHGLNITYPM